MDEEESPPGVSGRSSGVFGPSPEVANAMSEKLFDTLRFKNGRASPNLVFKIKDEKYTCESVKEHPKKIRKAKIITLKNQTDDTESYELEVDESGKLMTESEKNLKLKFTNEEDMEKLKSIAKNISTLAKRTTMVDGIPALRLACNGAISYMLIEGVVGAFAGPMFVGSTSSILGGPGIGAILVGIITNPATLIIVVPFVVALLILLVTKRLAIRDLLTFDKLDQAVKRQPSNKDLIESPGLIRTWVMEHVVERIQKILGFQFKRGSYIPLRLLWRNEDSMWIGGTCYRPRLFIPMWKNSCTAEEELRSEVARKCEELFPYQASLGQKPSQSDHTSTPTPSTPQPPSADAPMIQMQCEGGQNNIPEFVRKSYEAVFANAVDGIVEACHNEGIVGTEEKTACTSIYGLFLLTLRCHNGLLLKELRKHYLPHPQNQDQVHFTSMMDEDKIQMLKKNVEGIENKLMFDDTKDADHSELSPIQKQMLKRHTTLHIIFRYFVNNAGKKIPGNTTNAKGDDASLKYHMMNTMRNIIYECGYERDYGEINGNYKKCVCKYVWGEIFRPSPPPSTPSLPPSTPS